jgi:hypothetical protein
MVLPVEGADGEKRIDVSEFGAKVHRVLNEPRYRNQLVEWPYPCANLAVPVRPPTESNGSQLPDGTRLPG